MSHFLIQIIYHYVANLKCTKAKKIKPSLSRHQNQKNYTRKSVNWKAF